MGTYVLTSVEGQATERYSKEIGAYILGRYYATAKYYVFRYPASGIMFGFKGTSLEIDFGGETTTNRCWVKVSIDDNEPIVINVTGRGFIKVAEGLSNTVHVVKVQKRDEGNNGIDMSLKKIRISEGGTFYSFSYKNERKRIEVLGDSITCGWGNLTGIVAPQTSDYRELEDGTDTYATNLAEILDADLATIAISGIGVGNSSNMPYPILPSYKTDGNRNHDFTKNIPDLVIINLGTNDVSCGNTGDEFIQYGLELVRFIRSNYGDVTIIWTYGIMGNSLTDQIMVIINTLILEGDSHIFFLPEETKSGEAIGGAGHPTIYTGRRLAEELALFINTYDLMG